MTTLTLPALCDRAAVRAFAPDLRDGIGSDPLVIDASRIERIGQAMLQLLVSAARSEGGIAINSPSEALVEALRLTGLDAVLGGDIQYQEPGSAAA